MNSVPADATSAAPLLVARDIRVHFGGLHAVDGASLEVPERSIVALIGPNGAGKTTMFHALSGFVKVDTGSVLLGGRDVTRKSAHARPGLGMVRTFQIPTVFTRMRVRDNLLVAGGHARERLSTALLPGVGRRRAAEVERHADELLERFRLAPLANEYAGELSGGQRKLLELARALMSKPRLLLLDEPLAGVNPTLGNELLDHIVDLRDSEGMTVLFIEHDMHAVMGISDHVVCMAQGAVIASGTPDIVAHDPAVIDAYLGAAVAIEEGTAHD
ncbi:MAG: transporter related protein [Thermoleophilia bacterium]|nr:transporter related protein [Thermoleophilia bacterium]